MQVKKFLLRLLLILCVFAVPAVAVATPRARAAGPFNPAYVHLAQVATGLSQPDLVTNAGDGSGRLFIVEQPGRIRIIKNGLLLSTPFLNVGPNPGLNLVRTTGSEQGLLALAFHPSYASNGFFYVAYTAPRTGDSVGSVLTLERFSVSGNPDLANAGSGTILLQIDHPGQGNHNGGTLAFGADGFLYWSTGDGGSGGDPPNNSQNLGVLLGKILRLDVNSGSPYAIPPGNPFLESPVDNPATLPEIWAYGLRNPWRISFDRLTHDLYIGDVGQNRREEIDIQPAASTGGQNYGWRVMEGTECFNTANFNVPLGSCATAGLTMPITDYGHTGGRCAITGGYVYRGSLYAPMQGQYFFADYCTGEIFTLSGSTIVPVLDSPDTISSFGEDEQGELYMASLGGAISRLTYVTPENADTVGVFRPSNGALYLKNTNTTGYADMTLTYGLPGDYPVVGDWDGNGTTTIGIYRSGAFYLRNSNTNGVADLTFGFGSPGDQPVAGDWNGDGVDTIGVYRSSTGAFFLRNSNSAGPPDISFTLGIPGDVGLAGDWNADGADTTGVFRPSNGALYLKNTNTTGYADIEVAYGLPGDQPVTGDWDGNGTDTIGIYRSGGFYLRNSNTTGYADIFLALGVSGDAPIAGDWDGLP